MKLKKWTMIGCAAVMLLSLTGCQPTPEKQAVVNKSEGIPSDALVTQGADAQDGQEYYEPVSYQVSGHWEEDIQKDENFSIHADVDVMMPEITVFPVQKLEKLELTQERADRLIAYFMGEKNDFIQLPMPMTKADWEKRIMEFKEALAQVEAGGDGESPEALRGYIEEAEAGWAKAPETNEMKPADTKFTYQYDYYTGEPLVEEGENFISLAVMDGDSVKTVNAVRAKKEGGDSGTYFSYSECSDFTTESTILMQDEANAQDREFAKNFDEPYQSEEITRLDEQDERVRAAKEKFSQSAVDLDEMQEKAIALLKELGITGVQITNCEKALWEPDTGPITSAWAREYKEPTQQGCFVEFKRECGGIPCVMQSGGHWGPGMTMDGMYSAPFYPEQGFIVFDAEGNVKSFSWSEAANKVEQISVDSNILSFDEAKDRVADHLYWNNISHDPENDHWPTKLRFEVEEAKLIMTYINVKDEPNQVMIVPAWFVKAQGYMTNTDEGSESYGKESDYNDDEIIINALDGSPVLMPGVQREMEAMQSETP